MVEYFFDYTPNNEQPKTRMFASESAAMIWFDVQVAELVREFGWVEYAMLYICVKGEIQVIKDYCD